MAGKTTELSITIRAVDAATAKIKAINDRFDKLTKPVRDFREQLGKLRETSGLDSIVDGVKGVGSAIGDLLSKVAIAGGVLGGLGAALFHIVDEFDQLGDKAERFGVSVDFLASMRYAAEKAGAPVEALDSSMQQFSVNIGLARANSGRLVKFLNTVSPALLVQVKAAKSNEEAFLLMARAIAKVPDPARRAALAVRAGFDPAIVPLLAKGAAGIKELEDRFTDLAGGSLQDAADKAGATDDSLHDLHASMLGVKGAIVSGLAPALTQLVKQLTEWLRGHRDDIKEWAASLGKRIPAAVSATVDAVKEAVAWVRNLVDKIGGWKTVAIAVAAVMAGPLITAATSLGVALLTTPLGWVIASVTAIIALFKTLQDHFGTMTAVVGTLAVALGGLFALGPIKAYIGQIFGATKAMLGLGEASAATKAAGGGGGGAFGTLAKIAAPIAIASAISDATGGSVQDQARAKGWQGSDSDLAGAMRYLASGADTRTSQSDAIAQSLSAINSARTNAQQQAKITIDVLNALPGMRVSTDPKSTADVDLNVGFQTLIGAALP